jgi:hypothetical protein
MKSLKIPKEQSEAVNRRTDNTKIKDLVGWLVIWCLTPLSVSAISLRSGLLVEETGRSGENHRTAASH